MALPACGASLQVVVTSDPYDWMGANPIAHTMSDADDILGPPIGPLDYDETWDQICDHGHFDRKGNPISMRDWCRLRALGREYIVVEQTHVGVYFVSTVWLGLDHGMYGVMSIFETMVFDHSSDDEGKHFDDLDCERYATEDEALEGHARMVEKVSLFAELHANSE